MHIISLFAYTIGFRISNNNFFMKYMHRNYEKESNLYSTKSNGIILYFSKKIKIISCNCFLASANSSKNNRPRVLNLNTFFSIAQQHLWKVFSQHSHATPVFFVAFCKWPRNDTNWITWSDKQWDHWPSLKIEVAIQWKINELLTWLKCTYIRYIILFLSNW